MAGWGWRVTDVELDGARARVVLRTEHLRVAGWIDAAALREDAGLRGLGFGGAGLWTASHTVQVEAPPGTPLAHLETGAVIAVTLEDAYLRASWGQSPPEIRVQFLLPWGYQRAILRCGALGEAPAPGEPIACLP